MELFFDAEQVKLLLLLFMVGLALVVVACAMMYFLWDLFESHRDDFRSEYHDRENR